MNSSGIKRGLAASAVAALAVAGLPLLATSASAAPTASLVYSGPTRNGGTIGGMQVITVSEFPDGDGTPGPPIGAQRLKIIGSDLTTPATDVFGKPAIASATYSGSPTGTGAVVAMVTATTPTDGDTVKYALWVDVDNDNVVDGNEPRVQVSTVLTGAPTSVDVTPASQTVTTDEFSGDYTAVLKDAAGRDTQLSGAEVATIDAPASTTLQTLDPLSTPTSPAYVDQGTGAYAVPAAEAPRGQFAFQAKDSGSAVTRTIPVTLSGGLASGTKNVSLVVEKSADNLDENDIDVVTDADTWDSATSAFGAAEELRVDQTAITININDADDVTVPKLNANSSVLVTFTGANGVKFGGKDSTQVLVKLDALAKGTATANVDAGTVTENGEITISSAAFNGDIELEYSRPVATTTKADAAAYVTKIGSPTTVVVSVKDQFGFPATAPAQVAIVRTGRNAGTSARVTVDANGQATFQLADTGTTAGTGSFTINLYDDQFDATPITGITGGTINYTADGVGAQYTATAGTAEIRPLTDGSANVGTDASQISIAGGTNNAAATISVDNGALILADGSTFLDKATATRTIQLSGTGTGSFTVVGTKAGVATVTINSAGVTKTVPVTVKQTAVGATATNVIATARNVAIEGPEKAVSGDIVTFTATVTDAFGNPVAGVPVAHLPLVVNGPANLQSSDAATDAAGKLTYTVLLTDNANSAVTARVTGINPSGSATPTPQFGAAADSVTGTTKTEPGLTASQNTDSVTISDVVNLRQLEQAVADAEDAVDEAQADVDAANDDLVVAQAEKKVAQQAVKAAKQDLKKAKKQKKGVKAAKKELRSAKAQLTIAKAKVSSAQNKVTRAEAKLTKAQAELEAAEQALEDAQS